MHNTVKLESNYKVAWHKLSIKNIFNKTEWYFMEWDTKCVSQQDRKKVNTVISSDTLILCYCQRVIKYFNHTVTQSQSDIFPYHFNIDMIILWYFEQCYVTGIIL